MNKLNDRRHLTAQSFKQLSMRFERVLIDDRYNKGPMSYRVRTLDNRKDKVAGSVAGLKMASNKKSKFLFLPNPLFPDTFAIYNNDYKSMQIRAPEWEISNRYNK